MAVKLFAAEHISTAFYLTIDSDIRLVRPVQNASLFIPNGMGYINWEPRSTHPEWMDRSEELLNGTGCVSNNANTRVISVTPEVLHRSFFDYLPSFATKEITLL